MSLGDVAEKAIVAVLAQPHTKFSASGGLSIARISELTGLEEGLVYLVIGSLVQKRQVTAKYVDGFDHNEMKNWRWYLEKPTTKEGRQHDKPGV